MLDKKILRSFCGKKVVVTGGTGLIGREVVNILCEEGAHVQSVSLDKVGAHKKAKLVYGDLTNFDFCKRITKGIDFLFHVAGVKGSLDVTKAKPASFFVPILMMNTNILEAARINKVKKIVYTSSIGAYSNAEIFKESENFDGEPMDIFPGWAKRMAELQIKAYRIQYDLQNFAVVRPCNVYGPGDNFDPQNAMVIPSLMYRIYNKEDPLVIWGNGSAVRDFAFSRDVARGVILALYYGTGTGFVNLGSGKGYTIKELVETMRSFISFNYRFDSQKHSGFPRRVMDISLAKKTIGYEPSTSLLEGLKETWGWYIKNNKEYLNKQNYFKE